LSEICNDLILARSMPSGAVHTNRLLSGEAASAVARVTGFSLRWVEKLVARWNAEGPAGLGDRRRGNGAAPVLDEAGLAALAAALDAGPADGGLGGGARLGAFRYAERELIEDVCL
jgi:hypothetical protein